MLSLGTLDATFTKREQYAFVGGPISGDVLGSLRSRKYVRYWQPIGIYPDLTGGEVENS